MGEPESSLPACRWLCSKYGGRCILFCIIGVLVLAIINRNVFTGNPKQQVSSAATVIDLLHKQLVELQSQNVEIRTRLGDISQELEQIKQRPTVIQPPGSTPETKNQDAIPPPPGDNFCTHLPKGPVSPGSPWWKYLCLFERIQDETVLAGCRNSTMMGNWQTCLDKEYLPDAPCLVYSFGIANDWRFDDAMAKRGCQVFSFDPSMNKGDHQHSQNVTFKNMGLGATDIDDFSPRKDDYVKKEQKWKIRTLKSVIKLLGHEKTFIDVLKYDVEAYEWDVMATIIKDGLLPQIGQVLTEWHLFYNLPPKSTFEKHINLFDSLKDQGLQLFYKSIYNRKHKGLKYNSQCDTCYVNTKTNRAKFYSTIKT